MPDLGFLGVKDAEAQIFSFRILGLVLGLRHCGGGSGFRVEGCKPVDVFIDHMLRLS